MTKVKWDKNFVNPNNANSKNNNYNYYFNCTKTIKIKYMYCADTDSDIWSEPVKIHIFLFIWNGMKVME